MDLKTTLKQKKGLKLSLSNLTNKLIKEVDQLDEITLNIKRKRLEDINNEMKQKFDKIIELCNEDEEENYFEENSEIIESIDKTFAQIDKALLNLRLKNNEKGQQTKTVVSGVEIKLPVMHLPQFGGNIDEWITFSDLFQAAVTKNQQLSGAQKLSYLKGVLRGEPQKIIQSLPITDENFKIAWDLLSERYFHKREIVGAIVRKLLNLPPLHMESSSQILNLIDSTKEFMRMLETLELKIEGGDSVLLLFIIQQKLDSNTQRWFERNLKGDEIPTVGHLLEFLAQHARTLQGSKPQLNNKAGFSKPIQRKAFVSSVKHYTACAKCKNETHSIQNCPHFLKLNVQDRVNVIKNLQLCFNCFGKHSVIRCQSAYSCRQCNRRHHSLIHFEKNLLPNRDNLNAKIAGCAGAAGNSVACDSSQSNDTELNPNAETFEMSNSRDAVFSGASTTLSIKEKTDDLVLLQSAIIYCKNSAGEIIPLRALLDNGSQANFISTECAQILGIKKQRANIDISCLSESSMNINSKVNTEITNFKREFIKNIEFYVVSKITNVTPSKKLHVSNFIPHIQNIILADPHFNVPSKIHVLIGSEYFFEFLRDGQISIPNSSLKLQNSVFGYLVSGKILKLQESEKYCGLITSNEGLDEELKKFWSIEEVPGNKKFLTAEESECEKYFETTAKRENHRFTVNLPFKKDRKNFGNSRDIAINRLLQMEKRFSKNPLLAQEYHQFMNDYISLEHMEIIPETEIDAPVDTIFYLPHHAVPNKTGDKFRVVFDASAKSSNGVSLNDALMVGPQLQDDLCTLLLRFRMNKIAIVADVEKMYRQIIMKDSDYQRIVWRGDPAGPIRDYRLVRVAYGTASAPYLAIKSLQQLAKDEASNFPMASRITLRDFYVDDLISGAQSISEGLQLQGQLQQLLSKGGFQLRKWASNSEELLTSIPLEFRATNSTLDVSFGGTVGTLGVLWNTATDMFTFRVQSTRPNTNITKRLLLSTIAKLYDPLGWLTPITIRCKIMMQELWKLQLGWDVPVPQNIARKWDQLLQDLEEVNKIQIPRYLVNSSDSQLQLHGFSDASERAYSAVIYLRSVSQQGRITVQLVTSKTKVAPTRTVSLPRLELCGALLLTKLMNFVTRTLEFMPSQAQYYTDSTIVLAWLNKHPSHWKTFVANRVSKIHSFSSVSQWSFINSEQNAADLATRGITASSLQSSCWLQGPKFLHQTSIVTKSATQFSEECLLEVKTSASHVTTLTTAAEKGKQFDLITRFSFLSKLKRVTAYCVRFIHNCKFPHNKFSGVLSTKELHNGLIVIVKIVQWSEFKEEIRVLSKGNPLSTNCKFICLNPFLDSEGVLRIGGRLRHSNLPYNRKHPILLPKKHPFTEVIIRYYPLSLLHAGPQLVQSEIQNQFWIISARDIIRQIISKCITCVKINANVANQMMGDLPPSRVTPALAFVRCGVDYSGPFHIKATRGRGQKTLKVYIALFVCFITRAIHIELVSDLSTDSFIAALKRFISRRGKSSDIYSDCGSNFIGARRKLMEFYKLATTNSHNKRVAEFLSDLGVAWHFNPPGSPHMGGLWEAGIKSTKFHLKRIMGDAKLTRDEFETLLTQVEACLNSRPISELTSDSSEFSALTPGHFLIGRSLTSLPEPDYSNHNIAYLTRWQIMQKLLQSFWRRWSKEYLSRLQQRPKWFTQRKNIEVNDLCLLKGENMPPSKWKLGRIVKVFPGPDNLVRVVTVRTSDGVYKRNVTKICPLPV